MPCRGRGECVVQGAAARRLLRARLWRAAVEAAVPPRSPWLPAGTTTPTHRTATHRPATHAGGKPVLPNPGAKVAKGLEMASGLLGANKCQPKCCMM
jgi:hypothetical protein